MLSDAIGYPWTGEQKLRTILVGGILSVLGFLLLPVFVVYGYFVAVVRDVSAGDAEEPPVFDDWETLLVDGFKAFVISVVYSLLPAVVIGFGTLLLLIPALGAVIGDGSVTLGVVTILLAMGLLLVSIVLALLVTFLLPAALAAFVRTDRLGAAFSTREVRAIAGHGGYQSAWLVALVIVVAGGIVSGALAATVIGAILTPFVGFYVGVAASYAIGRGISDVPPVGPESDRRTTGQAPA